MNQQQYEKNIDILFEKTMEVLDSHGKNIPPYEIVYLYVKLATDLAYSSTENTLLATKLLMQSILDGIEDIQKRDKETDE